MLCGRCAATEPCWKPIIKNCWRWRLDKIHICEIYNLSSAKWRLADGIHMICVASLSPPPPWVSASSHFFHSTSFIIFISDHFALTVARCRSAKNASDSVWCETNDKTDRRHGSQMKRNSRRVHTQHSSTSLIFIAIQICFFFPATLWPVTSGMLKRDTLPKNKFISFVCWSLFLRIDVD